MRWIRPQLARIAGGWLVFDLCLAIALPAVLSSANSATAVAEECTCDHSDGQMCPMHHSRSASKPTSDSQSCACRRTPDPVTSTAASLVGPVGVLDWSATVIAQSNIADCLPAFNPDPLELSSAPEPHPPRA